MAETRTERTPERVIAARAVVPALVVAVAAFGIGFLANGIDAAVSALLGVIVVAGTFVVYVLVLGWARSVSVPALQAAVMGGWLIRLGIFVGVLLALRTMEWFDVAAFGLAGVVVALADAIYLARLWLQGLGEPAAGATGSGRTA